MASSFTTPRGFHSACEHLNTIATQDEAILKALIDVVYNISTLPNPTAATPTLPAILQSCSTYPTATLEAGLNATQHILFYSINNYKDDTAAIQSFLKSKTVLTPAAIEKVVQHYSDLTTKKVTFNTTTQDSQDKTIDIKWKIGLVVSSSNCEQIYAPYVSLSIDLGSQYEALEMNLSEFTQFSNTIVEIQQAFRD